MNAVYLPVGCHQRICSAFPDRNLKRPQVYFPERSSGYDTVKLMPPGLAVVSAEMLQNTGHPALMQPAQLGSRHLSSQIRIL